MKPNTPPSDSETRQDSNEVDPRPHWLPFLIIFGLTIPFLVLMVLGTIIWG